jgi:hypothetical protein
VLLVLGREDRVAAVQGTGTRRGTGVFQALTTIRTADHGDGRLRGVLWVSHLGKQQLHCIQI